MGGATTLTGPPVALFWLGGQANSEGVRSSIIVFFAISELATLIAYSVAGLFTLHVAATVVALALPYGAGLVLGTHGFRLASEKVFRIFALAMIASKRSARLRTTQGWQGMDHAWAGTTSRLARDTITGICFSIRLTRMSFFFLAAEARVPASMASIPQGKAFAG